MDNEMIYRNEINSNNDYRISITDFMDWLYNNETDNKAFIATIKKFIHNGFTTEELYFLAVDYSIPIVMIKWFMGVDKTPNI